MAKPLNRRSPIKVSNYFNKQIVNKLKSKNEIYLHSQYIEAITEKDRNKTWTFDNQILDNRGYEEYSKFFNFGVKKHGLGESLIDFLIKKFKKTNESVAILDIGYGQGNFLADIKKMLKNEKIPCKTDGISFLDNSTENTKEYIDKKINIPASEQVSRKKYDLITDLNGAINYEFNSIKKELILKYAYSLKLDGVLILNVQLPRGSPKLKFIINHLKKQGFNAGFYERSDTPLIQYKYNTLIIQRVK